MNDDALIDELIAVVSANGAGEGEGITGDPFTAQSDPKSLTEWSRHCGFEPAAHHQLIISELEALERDEFDRLAVSAPPGSAKTTYVSSFVQRLGTWLAIRRISFCRVRTLRYLPSAR